MEVNLVFKIHRKAKIEENPSKYLDADEEYKEYARGPRSIYWVTAKENSQYKEKENAVLMIDVVSGKIVNSFNSGRDAEKQTDICSATIFKVLAGTCKTAGGYYWRYKKSVLN